MNDFLIYAARLQDAGIKGVWVSFGTAKDRTRTMTVSVMGNDSGRLPRKFNLDGTDTILSRLKDDMVYEDGGPTIEKIEAAIAEHPHLKEDLQEWFTEWTPMPVDKDLPDEAPTVADEAFAQRTLAYMKGVMRGMDAATERTAISRGPAA